jgi:hypothetical protein
MTKIDIENYTKIEQSVSDLTFNFKLGELYSQGESNHLLEQNLVHCKKLFYLLNKFNLKLYFFKNFFLKQFDLNDIIKECGVDNDDIHLISENNAILFLLKHKDISSLTIIIDFLEKYSIMLNTTCDYFDYRSLYSNIYTLNTNEEELNFCYNIEIFLKYYNIIKFQQAVCSDNTPNIDMINYIMDNINAYSNLNKIDCINNVNFNIINEKIEKEPEKLPFSFFCDNYILNYTNYNTHKELYTIIIHLLHVWNSDYVAGMALNIKMPDIE